MLLFMNMPSRCYNFDPAKVPIPHIGIQEAT